MAQGLGDGAPPAAFGAPAFISKAWLSSVREPNNDVGSCWTNLAIKDYDDAGWQGHRSSGNVPLEPLNHHHSSGYLAL